MAAIASLIQVKKYFGFENMQVFNEEWKRCTDADRAELRELLAKEIESGRWVE